jgi:hypothetical protein
MERVLQKLNCHASSVAPCPHLALPIEELGVLAALLRRRSERAARRRDH